MSAASAPLILTPAKIGPVEIRNRLITSSMCLYFSGKNGEVTDKMIAFFENRAKSGMGAFILPANPHGDNKRARGSLADDSRIPQWKPLLDAVHNAGAKVFCQIHPSGIQFGRKEFKSEASPFELTTEELQQIIESYAVGALRAKKAGFDGVEIHGAHGHEVALLLSELLNTRTDQYGGSLENCARSVQEMIVRMKELCGPEFPVILRLSGEERIPGGRELPASLKICKIMQDAGVDAIHVSSGMPESEEWECPPSEVQQGHLGWMGKALKEGLKVPVIVVGRVVDWEVGERMIENGEADFIAVARTSLAEADWAGSISHLAKGELYPIRKCIGCNQGCRTRREQNKSMAACLQNPILGREELIHITEDLKDKNLDIAVVGGGVSGLEAANILSKRGARVTLFERGNRLGGTFYWASKAPGKAPYTNVIDYYEKLLPSQGVKILLNSELDAIPQGNWNLVVLATGGSPIVPPIAINKKIKVWSALEFIERGTFNADCYVIVGDGIVGYEVADAIIEKDKKAIIIGNDPREQVATLGVARWHFMEKRFAEKGVMLIRHSTVQSIDAAGLTVKDKEGAERHVAINEPNGSFECVLACGYKPATPEDIQKFQGIEMIIVGNAEKSGDAMDAIHDAFEKALAVSF
ncbi:MAG: NAD(P)/FAD-dependent oxidoreductase [Synergistaceae bacterium]|jgi:2,4-dienoyl-CoA reductase-like NADH-dependent reductase (Old Yellow Enzyme family)/NADPH-dependent 2,4-dienoyl-CoA reductase/sulfur reductase-like enzyme|nr:NAD(P)/FAD-dependent oxidoreductase [Synergistaceae bacterium]